jgi:hypothetical protein
MSTTQETIMAKDQYANIAYGNAIEAVAGNMAFGEIHSGVSMFDKVAWLISRIEYNVALGYVNLILDQSDAIYMGLVTSNSLTTFALDQQAVLDYKALQESDFGTPANAILYEQPMTRDFSTLPGGGLLVPPNPIYMAVQGISLAAVARVMCRIYFTYVELKPEEYWELVEARRLVQ